MMFSRSTIIFLFVALTAVLAQRPNLSKSKDRPILNVFPRPTEVEGDAEVDLKFDLEITNDDNETPSPKLPTVQEARRVYNSQIAKVASEAAKAGDRTLTSSSRVSINPVFQYYSLETWQKPVLKCCPRSWNYQCRSSNVRLPCFQKYYAGAYEWCCPIWPSLYIKRCMCSQCAVLTSTCAHEGRCHRRYTRRSFLAVCYRNSMWGFLRYITKDLPSSCYCRI